MKTVKLAFSGFTGQLLNYANSDTRNTKITRTSAGKYTITFLTACDINETEVAYPIINVNCQSPIGTGTVINVLNPTATYQSANKDGYVYNVSFQIETQNVINPLILPSSLLTLLGAILPLLTFVDRSVVMVSCQLSELCKKTATLLN